MQQRLDTPEGRARYGRRFATVEPVFANLRHNKRLDRFTLRGRVEGGCAVEALLPGAQHREARAPRLRGIGRQEALRGAPTCRHHIRRADTAHLRRLGARRASSITPGHQVTRLPSDKGFFYSFNAHVQLRASSTMPRRSRGAPQTARLLQRTFGSGTTCARRASRERAERCALIADVAGSTGRDHTVGIRADSTRLRGVQCGRPPRRRGAFRVGGRRLRPGAADDECYRQSIVVSRICPSRVLCELPNASVHLRRRTVGPRCR